MQHRGGPAGFLRHVAGNRIGFADYRGNKQYISTANLADNDRVSLFLMDDIGHVEFNAVSLKNAWAMWRAIVALLSERL